MAGQRKVLFITSTMPSSDTDPVPAFVKDEAIWLNKVYPDTKISIIAPHNAYSQTANYKRLEHYEEHRFHYFWPFELEKLTGRGIQPALRKNKLLYVQLPFLFLFQGIYLYKFVRKHRPDIIYAHWFTPQAITAFIVSRLTKVPFVFDTQASDVIVLKKLPFAKKLVQQICKEALAYTAPSQQTADKLLYFAQKNNIKAIKQKLHIIPMGANKLSSDPRETKKVLDSYGLSGRKYILFMGRLVDRKGVDTLIEAFRNISLQKQDIQLVIAGDGQDREQFQELARSLGVDSRVIFTGFITGSEKASLLNNAEIFTVPSVNVGDNAEGLPIVFMEAVLSGNVTVISDATGAHEVVTHSANSFVFKAGSVEDLEVKLNDALSLTPDQRKKFKGQVRKLATRFEWQTIINQRAKALHLV